MTTESDEEQKRVAAGFLSTLDAYSHLHPAELLPVVEQIIKAGVLVLPNANDEAKQKLRIEALHLIKMTSTPETSLDEIIRQADRLSSWIETGQLPVQASECNPPSVRAYHYSFQSPVWPR